VSSPCSPTGKADVERIRSILSHLFPPPTPITILFCWSRLISLYQLLYHAQ